MPTHDIIDNRKQKLVDKIGIGRPMPSTNLAAKRAESGTGIRACADVESQTRMSVAQWEREIDQLVYRLYGLTEEEIKIVEEGAK